MSTRQDFEEWFFDGAESKASERNADGAYKYMPAAQAWAAWQASAENEREACAKVCDILHSNWKWGIADPVSGPSECASEIRARSNA